MEMAIAAITAMKCSRDKTNVRLKKRQTVIHPFNTWGIQLFAVTNNQRKTAVVAGSALIIVNLRQIIRRKLWDCIL
jgi:hypothetical protein